MNYILILPSWVNNKSGTIELSEITAGFKNISLDGQFNDYLLNLKNLSYSISMVLEFTDLKSNDTIYPEQKRKALIDGKATIDKHIGNQSGDSHVKLECSNCNIVLH